MSTNYILDIISTLRHQLLRYQKLTAFCRQEMNAYMEMYKLHYELTGHAVDEMPLEKHLSVLNSRRSSGTKGMSI